MSAENCTCCKVWGLAITEDGNPDWGYVKLEGAALSKDAMCRLLAADPDDLVMIAREEYDRATEEEKTP